jgi:UDPglucose 6-dehydrogenase
MRLSILGTGYVGLVTGTCLAEIDHNVVCADIDAVKIENLKRGILPIYEEGLGELVARNFKAGRLHFTEDLISAIQSSEVVFNAVGTPSTAHGEADLSFVYAVAQTFAEHVRGFKIFVNKSTVPVGTAEKLTRFIRRFQKNKKARFEIVSNPEFLREGLAVQDFLIPDRIIVGTASERARKIMEQIYRPIVRAGRPLLCFDIKSAELTKYAANAMLATRISFMNEIANFADCVGGDVRAVARGIGLDTRIGPRFLHAGIGYGGSCFPKDVVGLLSSGREADYAFQILKAVDAVNTRQRLIIVEKLQKFFKNLKGKKIAVWGLAFKPKTDDLREAPALDIIHCLLKLGAQVCAFDPVAQSKAQALLPQAVQFAPDLYAAASSADALLILTEWDEFRTPDFKKLKRLMRSKIIVDGRNILERTEVEKMGFEYGAVGC